MAHVDTTILEAEAQKHDGHAFDVVQLVSMGGALGAKVWFQTRLIEDVGAALKVKHPPAKRLLVAVEDDHRSEVVVQRVRAALRWLGELSPCPF